MKLEYIDINEKNWLNGSDKLMRDGGGSFLRRQSDGKECCMGTACRHFGLKIKDILGLGFPSELYTEKKEKLPSFLFNEDIVFVLADKNDGESNMTNKQRLAALNKILIKHKVPYRFRFKKK